MDNRFEYIHKINNFITVLNALYHRSSVKLGISDSVFVVLYEIFDEGDECSPRFTKNPVSASRP